MTKWNTIRFLLKQIVILLNLRKCKFIYYLYIIYAAQKMFPTDLVLYTEEILNGKLHFLCSVIYYL